MLESPRNPRQAHCPRSTPFSLSPTAEPRTSCKGQNNRIRQRFGNFPEGLSVSVANSDLVQFGNSGPAGKLAGGQYV